MYHKRIFLFASMVAMFLIIGISYANFSDRLHVSSTISTGFIEPVFEGASLDGIDEDLEFELYQSDKELEIKVPFGFEQEFSLKFNIWNNGNLPIFLDEDCDIAQLLNDELNIKPEDKKEDIKLKLSFLQDRGLENKYKMVFKPSVGSGSWEKELNIIISQQPGPALLEVAEVIDIEENQIPLGSPIQGNGTPEGVALEAIPGQDEMNMTEQPDQAYQEEPGNEDSKPEDEPEDKSEDNAEPKSEERAEEESEYKPEDKSEDGSQDKSEDKSEDGSEDKSEDGSEDKSEDKADGAE